MKMKTIFRTMALFASVACFAENTTGTWRDAERPLHDLAREILEPGTYIFTSFMRETLAEMRRLYPDALDEIVFVGDDFGDGGGDSHIRIKGMDYIQIEDYRDFPRMVSILLK